MENQLLAYEYAFPIVSRILASVSSDHFNDVSIAVKAHLTPITAHLMQHLSNHSGSWNVIEANPHTTNPAAAEFIAGLPNTRILHTNELSTVDLLLDVGGELILHQQQANQHPRLAIEITQSGISLLREETLDFPVLNVNDSPIKSLIERRFGVGEGLWQAFCAITGLNIAGRNVSIFGFGLVGQGIADYARSLGAHVTVVEIDPIRRLQAHYQGYTIQTRSWALQHSQIIVTATGSGGVLSLADMEHRTKELYLFNAAHNPDEFPLLSPTQMITTHWQHYLNQNGVSIHVLGNGSPLNIVCNSGSAEPVLLQFALCAHILSSLLYDDLPDGLQAVPDYLNRDLAETALTILHPEESNDH